MNAITTQSRPAVPAISDAKLIEVMRGSLYPGAKPESVGMALSYCCARGLDPMLKPVHIVPMWVKGETKGSGAMRDVVMPGIGLYRIDAARTGGYAGKSEPEFGPMVKLNLSGNVYQVPEWCKVTVSRIVQGHVCHWTACEYWIENYATAGRDTDAPNAMWGKRARDQLAKCAEAQALRMAFPEAIGDHVTGEEMEGKTFPPMEPATGPAITGTAERGAPIPADFIALNSLAEEVAMPSLDTWRRYCLKAVASLAHDGGALVAWRNAMEPHLAAVPSEAALDVHVAIADALDALVNPPNAADDGWPGPNTAQGAPA